MYLSFAHLLHGIHATTWLKFLTKAFYRFANHFLKIELLNTRTYSYFGYDVKMPETASSVAHTTASKTTEDQRLCRTYWYHCNSNRFIFSKQCRKHNTEAMGAENVCRFSRNCFSIYANWRIYVVRGAKQAVTCFSESVMMPYTRHKHQFTLFLIAFAVTK